MTYFKKKKSLEIEYAKRVAMAEVLDFKQGIIKSIGDSNNNIKPAIIFLIIKLFL